MDSIEVQQMKAQAKEEKARKKVKYNADICCKIIYTQRATKVVWILLDCTNCSFFVLGFPLDGTSDPGPGEADEGGSRASKRRDGAKTFPAAGRGSACQRGAGELFVTHQTLMLDF